MISIFALMLLGYGARKAGILSVKDSNALSNLLVYIAFPATIFVSLHGKPVSSAMISVPAVMIGIEIALMGAAYGIGRALKFDNPTIAALMLISAFGNTAFLGFPVIKSAFGGDPQALPSAVVLDQISRNIVINTIGIWAVASMTGAGYSRKSLLELLKSPMLIAAVLAIATQGVNIPTPIMSVIQKIDGMTVPMSMICIGLTLSIGAARQNPTAIGIAFLLKMIAFPVLTWLSLSLIGEHGTVGHVAVVESAMPTAIIAGVLATKYNANGQFASGAIFVMTLISVVWLPLVMVVLK